jgi:carbon-monoxide dehydrogenase small subunit
MKRTRKPVRAATQRASRARAPARRPPRPAGAREIRLRVNGREVERTVEVRRTLADFLREDLSLTGTHLGCEHGVCGACTVLFDGVPVRSCLLFAVQVDGGKVMTVEALGEPDALSPLQQAFVEHHGLQCGFCTPGILMSAHALLRDRADPTDDEIREVLGGHLCRCTGYQGILDAVRAAARGGGSPRQQAAGPADGTAG